jgi:hypothetical protein
MRACKVWQARASSSSSSNEKKLARCSPAVAAEVQQQLQQEVEARHARLHGLTREHKQQQE